MREFNVGDKVKCIDAIGSINRELKNGETYIVSHVDTNGFVKLKGLSSYYYDPSRFKKIEYTYEDLKKSPIGTKITFENGAVLVKDEKNCFENLFNCRDIANLCNLKDNYSDLGKIIKIEEPTYTTVYEAKPEILDEVEKRYLKNFITPFKESVETIRKLYSPVKDKEYIQIRYKDDRPTCLPYFKKNTMYKDMKENRNYTLEELGL